MGCLTLINHQVAYASDVFDNEAAKSCFTIWRAHEEKGGEESEVKGSKMGDNQMTEKCFKQRKGRKGDNKVRTWQKFHTYEMVLII